MKIAFDAKRAAQNQTGLGNYSRFVIEGLSTCFSDNEYSLYIPKQHKTLFLGGISSRKNCKLCYPQSYVWKKLPSLWRVRGINKQLTYDRPDIFHGLSNELPIGIEKIKGLKKVVTIHDLIFLRYPQFYRFIDRNIYAYKFRQACINADAIVAVSECTKRDIIRYFNIPEEKIKVIYQGCDTSFRHTASDKQKEEARCIYSLPKQYLLYVGSIESRKNLMLIIKALTYTKSRLPVVAIGKHTEYADQVIQYARKNNLTDRLIMLHNVKFQYFPAIYQMASLFIYPSFFEGFGIPLLEALYSKIPIIGATGSCLEEAGGPHSIYVDPTDELSLANSIDRIIDNPHLQEKMIGEGLKYTEQFAPEFLSKELIKLYNSLD